MVYSLPTHDAMVSNIRAVYFSATDAQVTDGANWYADAANLARSLSASSGYPVEVTSAVIAALSPNTGWGQNVRLAVRMIESDGTLNAGGLPDNLRKARGVMVAGADIRAVLFGLNGNKVLAFFEGILTFGQTDAVCVDRHAFCIAVDDRSKTSSIPKLSPKLYGALAAAYRDAADGTPFTPAQVQAITWVTWRNRYWSKGSFDVK